MLEVIRQATIVMFMGIVGWAVIYLALSIVFIATREIADWLDRKYPR